MSSIPLTISSLNRQTIETITGNMLGDGGLFLSNIKRTGKNFNDFPISGNARYGMTMSVKNKNYLESLYNKTYFQFSSTGIKPYPNISLPQNKSKEIQQYQFYTRSLPLFTSLHNI